MSNKFNYVRLSIIYYVYFLEEKLMYLGFNLEYFMRNRKWPRKIPREDLEETRKILMELMKSDRDCALK